MYWAQGKANLSFSFEDIEYTYTAQNKWKKTKRITVFCDVLTSCLHIHEPL